MPPSRRHLGQFALALFTADRLLRPRPAAAAPAALEALLAPSARAWPRWAAHDPKGGAIDHAAWSGILARLVRPWPDGSTRVAWRAATPAIRAELRGAIAAMEAVPVSRHPRAEQFAFWANLYNALTLRVVLDHYPVASIRDIDISPGLFASGPWGARLAVVEGEPITLNDIEHRILRPLWADPRVHYAVNCASIGCPDLLPRAFTGAGLEAQLDRAASGFVNHPRAVTPGPEGVVLSSLYNWFAEDFSGAQGVLAHLQRHAAAPLLAVLATRPAIAGYRYDWGLNDAI